MARKYLVEEELRIDEAEKNYLSAVFELQKVCTHSVVLEHIDYNYHMFRVCEDCGITCRADWSSPVWAFGEKSLMGKRAYKVSWTEFASACPKIKGWCKKND